MTKKQLLARLGQIILVLLGISFITFALVMLAPGDVARQMIAGNEDIIVSQAEIDALRAELGLDKPFFFQYLDWLGRALQGNLGFSYMVKKPVVEALMEGLPGTIVLSLTSLIMMMMVAIPAGIYSAVKRGSMVDNVVRAFTFMGVSMPGFWVGLMLLWIFGLKLDLLPIVGGEIGIDTLILRGMSESHILWKEVLPNAMLPLITLLGLSLGNLLGGAAVIEMVFQWPGLGRMAIEAITYRDFQLVQGVVVWIALMYMVINLIVDISYNYLDPRLRKVR